MNKQISYVDMKKNKSNLKQCQITIDIENRFILDKLLENKMPFSVFGKEAPAWRYEEFEETDFAKDVQRLLKISWEEVIGRIEEISETKGSRVDKIVITIISSGQYIIPIFQIDYHYNDEEDYGHDVYNSYIATQQVEEYYAGWTGEPMYLPTEELLIEFNLNLEKKYKKKCIFKNIDHLDYRT